MRDINSWRLFVDYLTVAQCRIPPPSTAAKSSQYAKLQANPRTAIHDGFFDAAHPADTSALPIEIYHPVFQRFVDNITTTTPSEEVLNEVQKLMTVSTGVGTLEEPLAERLRVALTEILGKHMGQGVTDGGIPDGSIEIMIGKHAIPVLMLEYKRALGEGGCDALTQASHSTWKRWRSNRVSAVSF